MGDNQADKWVLAQSASGIIGFVGQSVMVEGKDVLDGMKETY